MSLCLQPGEECTRAVVEAVVTPPRQGRYAPVGYGDCIAILEDTVKTQLGLDLISDTYGLSKNQQQLFAHFIFDVGDTDGGLAVGLRQSLNKTLALGTVLGKGLFICSNLQMFGELKLVRKNTTNAYADYRMLLAQQMSEALQGYSQLKNELESWKTTLISEREGYQMIGVAMGHVNVLTAQQGSIALQDWHTPRHDFGSRSIYSLYQCFTEGLKRGAPARTAERHLNARSFMQREVLNVEV